MKCKTTAIMINLFFFISFVAILVMAIPTLVQASSSQTVSASIKISVCGNDVAEGGEDCDNADLAGKTCQSLGYGGGTLTCDISCSFDASSCTAPTPTPTPSSTPTPTPSSSNNSSSTNTSEPTSSLTATQIPTTIPKPTLPLALQIFDINGVGKILISDLPIVVKLWVDEWKRAIIEEISGVSVSKEHKKCDVNNDGRCDMKDFSVLMFYVER